MQKRLAFHKEWQLPQICDGNKTSTAFQCKHYISHYIQVDSRKDACIQLKFHAICRHQVYYLYYALKITKIYFKNHASINASNNEIEL